MELLVGLLAEFVLLPLLLLLEVLITAILAVAAPAIEMFLTAIGSTVPFLRTRRKGGALPDGAPRWPRRTAIGLGAGAVVLLLLAVLHNTVLFEPSLRWAFAHVKERAGIEVSFAEASGNFITGHVELRGLEIRRKDNPSATFDLRADSVEILTNWGILFGSDVPLRAVRVRGVTGRYERRAPPAGPGARSFTIDLLDVENARLTYRDHPAPDRSVDVELVVDRLRTRPFESANPVLSVLFRSNASGSIDGAPFDLAASGDDGGRTTTWKAERVPIALLGDYLRGPVAWIKEGTVDLDVRDSWKRGPPAEIDMDWKLVFRDIVAEAPADDSRFNRLVAAPVVKHMNAHSKELPVAFSVVMNREDFEAKWSLGAAGLWKAVATGLLSEFSEASGVPKDIIRSVGRGALESFKEFLDRKRGAKPED